MKTRNIVRAINSVKSAKKKLEKMNRVYPERYKDELEDVGKFVTAKWYASYDRLFYRPIESLFDAFRVNLDGTDYSVEFDSSFMDTGRDNDDYIFENSFMQGYHGGAVSGPGHPSPGIPYWRTPYPALTFWGRPALRSFSPYNRMVSEMKRTIKEIDEDKQAEFDRIVERVNRNINKLF